MTLLDKFNKYHEANPHVYEMFKRFAWEAIQAGRKTLSAKFIFERIRWETEVSAKGDEFKVNNNYHSYYARHFMAEYPDAPAKFRTRATAH